jgi:hypothetical protein
MKRALIVGALGWLAVVPMLHISGPVYPHARIVAHAVTHHHEAPVPLPMASAPASPASASHGAHIHAARGYVAWRLWRHIRPWRRARWHILPWWMRRN